MRGRGDLFSLMTKKGTLTLEQLEKLHNKAKGMPRVDHIVISKKAAKEIRDIWDSFTWYEKLIGIIHYYFDNFKFKITRK